MLSSVQCKDTLSLLKLAGEFLRALHIVLDRALRRAAVPQDLPIRRRRGRRPQTRPERGILCSDIPVRASRASLAARDPPTHALSRSPSFPCCLVVVIVVIVRGENSAAYSAVVARGEECVSAVAHSARRRPRRDMARDGPGARAGLRGSRRSLGENGGSTSVAGEIGREGRRCGGSEEVVREAGAAGRARLRTSVAGVGRVAC